MRDAQVGVCMVGYYSLPNPLKYNTTTREHGDGHERTIGDHRALNVLVVKLVPSNGGVRLIEGGFGPAPSNVITVDWRG